ncbi:YqcC family protein [Aliiglaciecola sp. LCG003]|uniref:YqcC family protein n=1 Tax=Aliiglaciecola sp. LCG003 TaxID=3053655 RepID=UPI002573C2D4|nr:YqcC family protein [Aliiglaciecola sp. LCG003]WJG08544.1 YqcC family protein [Aliiglaciecola sp. LCG003]
MKTSQNKSIVLRQKLPVLLDNLRDILQIHDLWSSTVPSEQAMGSRAPFACDSMPLENWLQFVFLPKLEHLLEQQQRLPENLAILPIAQIAFSAKHHEPILLAIEKIDRLFNAAEYSA